MKNLVITEDHVMFHIFSKKKFMGWVMEKRQKKRKERRENEAYQQITLFYTSIASVACLCQPFGGRITVTSSSDSLFSLGIWCFYLLPQKQRSHRASLTSCRGIYPMASMQPDVFIPAFPEPEGVAVEVQGVHPATVF